jgi:hypothetical protein
MADEIILTAKRNPDVSLYHSAYKSKNKLNDSHLASIFTTISGNDMRDVITELRKLSGKEYEGSKLNLAAFTPCGVFSNPRSKTTLESFSNFFHFDIDAMGIPAEQLKGILSLDPFVAWMFISPSGCGVKGGLYIPESIMHDLEYKVFFAAAERYFRFQYGLTIDPACKDVSRLCFLSHDPDVYVNEESKNFPWVEFAEAEHLEPPKPPAKPGPIGPPRANAGADTSRIAIERCLDILRTATKGGYHYARLKAGTLAGGYVAGCVIENEGKILGDLYTLSFEISQNHGDSDKITAREQAAITDGFNYGVHFPLCELNGNRAAREF